MWNNAIVVKAVVKCASYGWMENRRCTKVVQTNSIMYALDRSTLFPRLYRLLSSRNNFAPYGPRQHKDGPFTL